MKTFAVMALVALVGTRLAAQGRVRLGPTVSSISIEDASGNGHAFTSYGVSFGLVTGDDGEMGATIARYHDLSADGCPRALTLYGLDEIYYPIGPRGLAPYASTEIGLARVTQVSSVIGGCGGLLGSTTSTSSELGYAFGLGVRVNLGNSAAGLVEGRYVQVPNSAIQALEARANVSVTFGKPRASEILAGTLGPSAGVLVHLGGDIAGRGPLLGVRFRRDTKKSSALGLEIDYAPLRASSGCSTNPCDEAAILFAPGYEPSLHPAWGRLYFDVGALLAGFYSQGPDRGVGQGAHAGLGADIFGGNVMWNVNGRVLWLQRNTGDNVFAIQIGASVMPKLEWKRP